MAEYETKESELRCKQYWVALKEGAISALVWVSGVSDKQGEATFVSALAEDGSRVLTKKELQLVAIDPEKRLIRKHDFFKDYGLLNGSELNWLRSELKRSGDFNFFLSEIKRFGSMKWRKDGRPRHTDQKNVLEAKRKAEREVEREAKKKAKEEERARSYRRLSQNRKTEKVEAPGTSVPVLPSNTLDGINEEINNLIYWMSQAPNTLKDLWDRRAEMESQIEKEMMQAAADSSNQLPVRPTPPAEVPVAKGPAPTNGAIKQASDNYPRPSVMQPPKMREVLGGGKPN